MKSSWILSFSVLLTFSALFGACRHDRLPAGVMDSPTMTSFLKEAYLLEGFYAVETDFRYDSLHAEMQASFDSLLDSYNLSREDFERSIDYYTRHPHDYLLIHQQVVAELDSLVENCGQ